jgi:anti-anti-sigma regulatory factor/HAMP domain-containing protein
MASFIASPIFDGEEMLGVLVFQMPVDRINETMTSRRRWADVGLGRTGEVYLVGGDRTLRSEPRLLIEDEKAYIDVLSAAGVPRGAVAAIARDGSAIGRHPSQAPEIARALDGETGTARSVGYRGEPVHMAFRPLTFRGLRWAVVSEMAEDEAQAPALALRNKVLLEVLVVVLAIAGVAVLFARSLTRPLADLSRRASGLAAGDLESSIPVKGDAEVAELARSFEVMRSSIAEHQARQQRAIEALATPLIPLHDQVLVAPLVGELDDHRIAAISRTLVEGAHRSGARVAILDLTGVPAIDPDSAASMLGIVRTARLLGCRVITTGVRPAVAQVLSDIEGGDTELVSMGSLRVGVDEAMRWIAEGGAGQDELEPDELAEGEI